MSYPRSWTKTQNRLPQDSGASEVPELAKHNNGEFEDIFGQASSLHHFEQEIFIHVGGISRPCGSEFLRFANWIEGSHC
jgi:hypothetical protein